MSAKLFYWGCAPFSALFTSCLVIISSVEKVSLPPSLPHARMHKTLSCRDLVNLDCFNPGICFILNCKKGSKDRVSGNQMHRHVDRILNV